MSFIKQAKTWAAFRARPRSLRTTLDAVTEPEPKQASKSHMYFASKPARIPPNASPISPTHPSLTPAEDSILPYFPRRAPTNDAKCARARPATPLDANFLDMRRVLMVLPRQSSRASPSLSPRLKSERNLHSKRAFRHENTRAALRRYRTKAGTLVPRKVHGRAGPCGPSCVATCR